MQTPIENMCSSTSKPLTVYSNNCQRIVCVVHIAQTHTHSTQTDSCLFGAELYTKSVFCSANEMVCDYDVV